MKKRLNMSFKLGNHLVLSHFIIFERYLCLIQTIESPQLRQKTGYNI